jgi:peptidoglycan/LPS O-acetylase OafA/YrhL
LAVSRIPPVELLRVLATAAIFLFHLWTVIPLSSESWILGPSLARLPLLGALGVIVFNCITGFVLSVRYLGLDGPRPTPGALEFFRARARGICPHYYLALGLWTLPWLVPAAQTQSWPAMVMAFVTHVFFLHTLHASTFFAIVPAFWWLAMLAQFYLVYPWLVWFFARVGPGMAFGLVCVICWGAWLALAHAAAGFPGSTLALAHYLVYFNLPVRLPEFALGMWLAAAWNRAAPFVRSRPVPTAATSWRTVVLRPLLVGLLLFLALNGTVLGSLPPPVDHLYLVLWCTCGVLAVLRWPLADRLGGGWLTLNLAGASYGIYLLHQPLLIYSNQALAGVLGPAGRFVVLLVGAGWLSYRGAVGLNRVVGRAMLARALRP